VVRVDDTEYVVADIPGLIEGASEGKGLGHQFLRHIERARALVVLVDLAAVDGRAAAEQERILLDELGRHRPDLLHRPRVTVGSKADMADPAIPWDGDRISAVTGEGLQPLVRRLASLVAEARTDEAEAVAGREAFVIHRPEPEGVRIGRADDGAFTVMGRKAERAVALSDLTNVDALSYAQHRLKQLGVNKALARAGARDGDLVHIGGFTFEYEADT
jgi:GTP-binding protein